MLNSVGELLKTKQNAVPTVTPRDKVSLAVRRMAELEIGALPLIENGKLVGMISVLDTMEWVIRDQEQVIDPLIGAVKMGPRGHRPPG
jgi:CBS domain-containing protein